MAWQWTWLAVPGLVAAALQVGMAAFVFAMAPNRLPNRALGAFLFLDSLVALQIGIGPLTDDLRVIRALGSVWLFAAPLAVAALLVFLSTLPSPILRWARWRPARWAIVTLGLAGATLLVFPQPAFDALQTDGTSSGIELAKRTPVLSAFIIALVVAPLLSLVVAVDAWVRAVPGMDRRRARAYGLAFGLRDIGMLGFFAIVLLAADDVARQGLATLIAVALLPAFLTIGFVLLLAWGIATTHLFDIDLRVRRGIARGTPLAMLVAVFFVVTVTAENFLTSRYGWAVGGAAAGLLLFALAPLQRLGERIAHRTTPDPTPEYLAFRKLDVYRAAVESALEEGGVSDKERAILARTAAKLGIKPADAAALEADVASRLAPAR